jgi:hypothetical protein
MTSGIQTSIGNYQLYVQTTIGNNRLALFPKSVTNFKIQKIGMQ